MEPEGLRRPFGATRFGRSRTQGAALGYDI